MNSYCPICKSLMGKVLIHKIGLFDLCNKCQRFWKNGITYKYVHNEPLDDDYRFDKESEDGEF